MNKVFNDAIKKVKNSQFGLTTPLGVVEFTFSNVTDRLPDDADADIFLIARIGKRKANKLVFHYNTKTSSLTFSAQKLDSDEISLFIKAVNKLKDPDFFSLPLRKKLNKLKATLTR